MLTKEVSQKYFNNALFSIHARQASSLFSAAWGLTRGAKLSLTSLGKHKDGQAYVKHKIKSVDRLLGNKKLHDNLNTIYKEFHHPLLTALPVIYLAVDWSGCCRPDIHMLRASVMYKGRSITIYNEIHAHTKVGNPTIHKRFLKNISMLIPSGKRVVVITDAGFLTPWFKAVLKLGWDYIGRLKGDIKFRGPEDKSWKSVKKLDQEATTKVKYIGEMLIGKTLKKRFFSKLYTYKNKPQGRKDKSRYPDINKRYASINKKALVLATSLDNDEYKGCAVVNIYKKRMQIEQNFRDDKSPRFGFGWRFGYSYSKKRIAVLCLIASIASFFLLILGTVTEKLGFHRRFQVNTGKSRVLSFLTLAKLIIFHGPPKAVVITYHENLTQIYKSTLKYRLFL